MNVPEVIVVGGGLAGLAAAVTCADTGVRVSLFEARPRLGGATWSFSRGELWIDNGQHVFLRCFRAYRAFLQRLGTEGDTALQARLALPVADAAGRIAWLRRSRLPSPLHLLPSLLRYRHLSAIERLRVARAARALAALDPGDRRLDESSLGAWLSARRLGAAAVDSFFDLLIRPALNTSTAGASLALAAMVFRKGLFETADCADLGVPLRPLQALHGDAASRLLRRAGATVALRAPVDRIEAAGEKAASTWVGGERHTARAVIVAADHEAAAELLPAQCGVDSAAIRALGRAPIMNLHLIYDRQVLAYPFLGTVSSPLQWIFDRSRAAGLSAGQYLAISLSAAQPYLGRSRRELRAHLVPELERILPAARQARLLDFFTSSERAATFDQRPGSQRGRHAARTEHPAIFVAGAWTDTGWPATMEGAVRSGLQAARAALNEVGVAPAPA